MDTTVVRAVESRARALSSTAVLKVVHVLFFGHEYRFFSFLDAIFYHLFIQVLPHTGTQVQ